MKTTLDGLSALEPLLKARPELQQICCFGGTWSSAHEPEEPGWAPFHIVTRGRCRLDTMGRPAIELGEGDVVVLPRGGRHRVASLSATAEPCPMRTTPRRSDALMVKSNTDGAFETGLICGRLRFENLDANLVLTALPDLIVLRADGGPDASRARRQTELIRIELEEDRRGAAAIGTLLASTIMIIALRAYFEQTNAHVGILALLSQQQTARVLAVIMADPAHDWSLDELAKAAAASRSTLVRLFNSMVEISPLAFLTEFRLNLARHRLHSTDHTIAEVALGVGYQSNAAFNRAYLRRYGIAPGADRRLAISGLPG